MRKGWLALGVMLSGMLVVGHVGCEVPPLMAPGSSVSIIANPEFIVANGGVSLITAIVTEPAGTLVPDGTVVLFFTNLGRIDPQGKTTNGVARVNLVADSRSGKATVTAISGGAAPAPAATGGGSSGAGGSGSATKEVIIGSALPDHLIVTADPQRLRGPGTALIRANVFDINGNPVANVPVIFEITATTNLGPAPTPPATTLPSAGEETLESGGAQRFTDNNGQAFDVLRTRAIAGISSKNVTVTATAANGKKDDVVVAIN